MHDQTPFTFDDARRIRTLVLAALLTCAACPTQPAPLPPSPDASDAAPVPVPVASDSGAPASPCAQACAALAAAGCAEGASSACLATMGKLDGDRLVREPSGKPLTCADVAALHTKADAHGLGLACP